MSTNDIGPRIGIDGEKQFRDSINAINAQMRALGNEMKAVTAEFAQNASSEEALTAKNNVLAQSIDAAKNKLATLDSQLDRQRGKLNELAQALDRAKTEFGENSREAAAAQNAYNRQYRTVADLEGQYQRTRQQLAEFENQMRDAGDAADQANDQLGGADVMAGLAAWEGIKTAVQGVSQALAEAVQVGMAFDSSISDVAATMGTTASALGELRGFAQEMGATTVFTATQAAEALNYMALAGYDAEKSMDTLPNVLNMAAAGGVELASASDMVTDAQSALALSMDQTAILVDEMAKASTKANQSVAEFGAGILEVGGTAKIMAGGTQEINQVLGILADNSIKGAEGGTKLRNVILALAAPTDKAAAQIKKLKLEVFDAEGNMRAFSDIFPEMKKALAELTDQDRMTALSEIFNNRDIAAAEALLGTTVERWNELGTAIDNAQGSAEKMAETRLDNLAGDVTLLQSAADGARIAFSDSLTPALRDAAQAGTGLLTFVGNVITEFPIVGQAATGLTAGLGVLAAGITATAVASTTLGGALAAAGAAAMASPWGLAAVAVGGLVTAFTALRGAAEEAKTANDQLRESLEESMEKLSQDTETAKENAEDLKAQAEAILLLAQAEELSGVQQQALLSMIEKLNAAVPGLNLAYDEQTGKLNMTADAVRNLTAAESERMTSADAAEEYGRLLAQQTEIAAQLREAEIALEEARAKNSAAMEREVVNGEAVIRVNSETAKAQSDAALAAGELQKQYDMLQQAMDGIIAEYGDVAASAEEAADGTEEAADSAEEAEASYAELAAAAADAEDAVLYLAGAADTLSDALKEQEKNGSLSLKTINELIDAGYSAALAIDTETGSVQLNKEIYVQLTQAKIDEQLATLEAARASAVAQAAAQDEMMQVAGTAEAYFWAAEAKKTFEGNIVSYDAQIAALQAAKNGINSYGSAATSAAKKSAGASKKIKTQAEKDLAEFKALKDEMDHEQAMGLIQDQEYYRRLAELRDQYLSDSANVEEYRKISETIHKADEKAIQEREKLWQTAGNNILKLEEDFQKELASRAQEIVNSYKLFDEVPEYQKASGQELITNLQDQINAIQGFYDNVAALEERGASAALVDEIRGMGVKASGELAGLLDLTDEQLTKYSELYGEKQALANRIAAEELGDLRAQTNEEIIGQLEDVADLYDTNAPALGMSFAENLAAGMFEGMPAVEEMARTVANAAMSAFENTFNRDVEAMMTASGSRVTTGDIGELMAGFANSMTGAGGAAAPQPLEITMQTRDGIEIARAFLPDIRTADRESPLTLDDT